MNRYELNGSLYTPNQLAELSGIPPHTIRDRLRRGYSVEEAIKLIPTHDSVKEFCNASHWEDWVGMTIDNLYNVYWQWSIRNGYSTLQKQGFSRQLFSMYPMLYTVPTKKAHKSVRYIRLRKGC